MKVKKGDVVKVEYEGRFEDGEVFDTSSHGDHSHPLEVTVGEGEVIEGFDNALNGAELNKEIEFRIEPEEAYGERRKELEQKIPKHMIKLPDGQAPKKGMTLVVASPDGGQMPVQILDVNEETITIDLNHPLAGKVLIFKVKVVEINSK